MYGFNKKELKILQALNTPRKIQDFLERLKVNFEEHGDTCFSPRTVLKKRKAHCIEAAMLAAAALRLHGRQPLIVDLTANSRDEDHVIAVFKQHGHWGAVSKSNHAVLKYREPVYKTIRELVMSYFHEYFDKKGRKNLRSYTQPVNLKRFDKQNWTTSEEDVWFVPEYLVDTKHRKILSRAQISSLRKADSIEIRAGNITKEKK